MIPNMYASGLPPTGPSFNGMIPPPPTGFGGAAVGVPYPGVSTYGGVGPTTTTIRTSAVEVGARTLSPIPGGVQTFAGRTGSPVVSGGFMGGQVMTGSVAPTVVTQSYSPPPMISTGAPIVSGIRNSRIGHVGPTTVTHVPPPPQYHSSAIRGSRTIIPTGPPHMVASVINQPPVTTTTVTDTFTSGFRGNNTFIGAPVVQPGTVTTVKEEIIETITPQQTFVAQQQTYIPQQQVIPQQTYYGSGQVGMTPYPQDYGCWYRFSNACPRICGLPWWIPLLLGLFILGGLIALGFGFKGLKDGGKVTEPAKKPEEPKTPAEKPEEPPKKP